MTTLRFSKVKSPIKRLEESLKSLIEKFTKVAPPSNSHFATPEIEHQLPPPM